MASAGQRAVFNHARDELPAQAGREPALVGAREREPLQPKSKDIDQQDAQHEGWDRCERQGHWQERLGQVGRFAPGQQRAHSIPENE